MLTFDLPGHFQKKNRTLRSIKGVDLWSTMLTFDLPPWFWPFGNVWVVCFFFCFFWGLLF